MPVLDTIRRYTPLGLRFWDAATETRVTGGLRVRVWPEAAPQQVAHGRQTASGDVAVHDIASLAPVEHTGDVGAVPPTTYVVAVDDTLRRFMPIAFTVDLPRAESGFFTLARPESPPEETPPGIYLFSAPTRQVPTTLAVVRAFLEDAVSGGPAAFAAMYVELIDGDVDGPPDDRRWTGMADASGVVQVLFPYPRVPPMPRASPPGEGRPLARQQWSLRIHVRYRPVAQDLRSGTHTPTLRSIFRQPPAALVVDASGAPGESATVEAVLRYRIPTVVRTAGLGPDEQGKLLVRPTTSPP